MDEGKSQPQCGAATCLGQKQIWELRDIGVVSLNTSLISALGPAWAGGLSSCAASIPEVKERLCASLAVSGFPFTGETAAVWSEALGFAALTLGRSFPLSLPRFPQQAPIVMDENGDLIPHEALPIAVKKY